MSGCFKSEGVDCVCDDCLEDALGVYGTVNRERQSEPTFFDEIKRNFNTRSIR